MVVTKSKIFVLFRALSALIFLTSCSEGKRLTHETGMMTAEIASLNAQLNSVIEETTNVTKDYQSIRYKSGQGESTVANLKSDAKKLETEVSMLMTEKERAQAEVDDLRKGYDEYTATYH
jgi:chromosome segregation ATPase